MHVPGVFILCMQAVSSSAITTGQPSKCMWLLTQLPYRQICSAVNHGTLPVAKKKNIFNGLL